MNNIPSWLDIIKPPKIILILGYVGKGKSGLAYYLAELAVKEFNLTGVVVNLPVSRKSLIPESWSIAGLDDVENTNNAVIIIDEGTSTLPAGSHLEEYVKALSSLCRQRNQTIILIFHASSDVGSRILRGVGPVLLKEPSRRQIQHGAKDKLLRELLTSAKTEFVRLKTEGQDGRKFVWVDCEEPDFSGIMENSLSSFWTQDLSCAWASEEKEPKTFTSIEEFLFKNEV